MLLAFARLSRDKLGMPRPRSHRFEAGVVLGHKGVVAAIVPFDPEETFACKPVRLAGRRHGWLVEGTVAGVAFDGYIGERWGRFFVTLDEPLLREAKVSHGETTVLVLRPTDARETFAKALQQSKLTTQPSKARADAVARKD